MQEADSETVRQRERESTAASSALRLAYGLYELAVPAHVAEGNALSFYNAFNRPGGGAAWRNCAGAAGTMLQYDCSAIGAYCRRILGRRPFLKVR